MCRSLVTLQPPIDLPPTPQAAQALNDRLYHQHGVEVPCFPFGDRVWLRISAQVYNAVEDYERLAGAF
jgi:isopenicillin-N epimerase